MLESSLELSVGNKENDDEKTDNRILMFVARCASGTKVE
jgi:hypothetical protein